MCYNCGMEAKNQKPIQAAAYCRISTVIHGQDINNQLVPIEDFCQARGFKLVGTYCDEGVSGARERRKELDRMVADAKKGKFKTLVVMEISRLARDVRHLLNLLHTLSELGVGVVSIREGVEFNSTFGKAMVAMIGVLVSVERDLLRERIKTALHTKKMTALKNGTNWRMGRPPLQDDLKQKVIGLRKDGLSVRKIAKRLGIGKTSVERILRGHR